MLNINILPYKQNKNTVNYSDKTFKIDINKSSINGFCDTEYALQQAISLMLTTKKYKNEIFFTPYGSELHTLIGKSLYEIELLAPKMIEEALLLDDRILAVNDFVFINKKTFIIILFTVQTIYQKMRISYNLGGD